MYPLSEHRADSGHLPHQPLQAGDLALGIPRQQLPGLAREVDQDRARFEHRYWVTAGTVGIDDRRHLVVGIDREIVGPELIAGEDIDRMQVKGQLRLREHNGDLSPVRSRSVIEFDHRNLEQPHSIGNHFA
jgi:hypothetical protein